MNGRWAGCNADAAKIYCIILIFPFTRNQIWNQKGANCTFNWIIYTQHVCVCVCDNLSNQLRTCGGIAFVRGWSVVFLSVLLLDHQVLIHYPPQCLIGVLQVICSHTNLLVNTAMNQRYGDGDLSLMRYSLKVMRSHTLCTFVSLRKQLTCLSAFMRGW